ncbi:hypothetical protein [Streptomyces sp. Wb2n-11]|uniref:hypothetical protein n=1 Tax=Streptomyces sp. Wb2n-11 TaxID=1030533 RepID=UPI000B01B315|nr:hypothetical protein [Streptomyces sp. Wb2n-11]
MSGAPFVVHRPSASGGRRVSVRRDGRDKALGLAHPDHDLVVFLEAAGVPDPEAAMDDPRRVEWRGGHPHQWDTA